MTHRYALITLVRTSSTKNASITVPSLLYVLYLILLGPMNTFLAQRQASLHSSDLNISYYSACNSSQLSLHPAPRTFHTKKGPTPSKLYRCYATSRRNRLTFPAPLICRISCNVAWYSRCRTLPTLRLRQHPIHRRLYPSLLALRNATLPRIHTCNGQGVMPA